MEIFLVLLLVKCVFTAPVENFDVEGQHYGNFDEWGPYYQGDMRFAGSLTRNGWKNEFYRWPGGKVPYELPNGLNLQEEDNIKEWIKNFTDSTSGCVEFLPRTNETDYIRITTENTGCSSYVGKIGGEQQLNLKRATHANPGTCWIQGIVQHELNHALGFHHEQSRRNRNNHVVINWRNIKDGYENNFRVEEDTTAFEFDYDYGSVMHYSNKAFSKNGKRTIVTTDPSMNKVIGQRVGLSETDILKVKSMYC